MGWWRSLVSMILMLAASDAVAGRRQTGEAVSVRIHDYANVETQQLRTAEHKVASIFERIGVRLEWRAMVRPPDADRGRAAWPTDVTDLTIVVLTTTMADRLRLQPTVAGYAPIERDRGGRIAFVVGDRTRKIAYEGYVDHADVLTGVIAHELAHLLMPERSHSRVGVMRPHWTPAEFRNIWRHGFSDEEGEKIRRMAATLRGAATRVAD